MKSVFLLILIFIWVCNANAVELLQGISKFVGASYWGGKSKIITVNGAEVLELTSTVNRNRYFGRAFASYRAKTKFAAGDRLVATAKVRGNGKFFIGILKYRKPGVMPITVFVEPIELTANAKEVKFVFELDDSYINVLPFIQVHGEGTVYVESFKFETASDKNLKLSKTVPPVNPPVKNVNKKVALPKKTALFSGIGNFKDQPYWGGKAKIITVGGKKVLELTSSINRGRHYGRAYSAYGTRERFSAKDKIIATAKVRGKGKFFVGILKYRPKNPAPVTAFVEPVELSDTAKELRFVFELEDRFEKVFPYIQVQSNSTAYIESFRLEKTTDKSLKVSPAVSYDAIFPKNNAANAVKPAKSSVIPLFSKITSFKSEPYWGGKARIITDNGKKVLELTSSVKNGRHYGRACAAFWTRELYFPEARIVATARVRGRGKFFIGILKYRPKVGMPVTVFADPVDISDTAKDVKFTFEIESFYEKVFPYVQVQGDGIAYVESFKMEKVIDPSVKIKVTTPLQVITENQTSAPIKFETSVKNGNVNIVKLCGPKNSLEKIKSDKNGNVTVPADKYSFGTHSVYASSKGGGTQSYVSVVTPEEYAKTDAIARNIKIKKPIKMLVLGDSLSDFYRGSNYIDRINFWINKYNPGKFSFHNAGVAGDFLERSSNRMEVELKHLRKWVYRQDMYSGIFKNEYDYVFIWLGQNDTRCMRKQGYKIPETTPEEQNKYLTLMLKRLKEKCPKAKVVLIAPSPSDESVFANREKTWAKNRDIAYYGKPEFLDAYDAVNREICKKYKLDYIDMLTVMRNYKPIKDIYVIDAVHLSDKGGIVVSDELLKYFAKEFK